MIGTWNVRTLSETSRLEQVCKEMISYKLDILGLSEVRWLNNGCEHLPSGHRFIYAGNTTSRVNGVGILLSPKASRALLEYRAVADRILIGRLNSKFRKISIVQCYAPTEPDGDAAKDDFYNQLEAVINSLPGGDIKIIIGDINAKVGNDNNNLQSIMGKHGLNALRNNNGDRLVDFCARNHFFIGGTKFPHKNIHKYTWESPNGRTFNQIDHFLINKLFLGSLLDVKTRRGADIDSDHQLLVATLRLRPAAVSKNRKATAKYNVALLNDPNIAKRYNDTLACNLQELNEKTWTNISTACRESAVAVLGTLKRKKNPWISNDTWSEIANRKCLRNVFLRVKSPFRKSQAKSEYRSSCAKVKKMVATDREKYYNSIAQAAEQASNIGNLRGVYSAIKQLNGSYKRCDTVIKDAQGNLATTLDEQLRCWRDYFSSQSSSDMVNLDYANDDIFCRTRRNPRREICTEPPTLAEVTDVLNALKKGKAPGPDNLPAELFRCGVHNISKYLTPIIRDSWQSEHIPIEWKEGAVITLPKKGDLSLCKNWRGITLLNTIGKVMASIILNRIMPVSETILRKEQAGFRRGRSCADHINTLRIIRVIEQSAEYNSNLYLLFVDFERAFDTISRNAMWKALAYKGIPDKIIALIRNLYCNAQYRVRFNGDVSETYSTTTGVRQGCVLSPTLFLILLDCVIQQTNIDAPFGIRWNMSEYLNDIDYADDICLMAHRFEDIQAKLIKLEENAKKVGLKINIKKTKLMRIGTSFHTPLMLNGSQIEDVDSFCYLGSKVTKDGGTLADINDRINKARGAFIALCKVWKSKQISSKTKLRIFNSSVISVLLYGCTTWSLSKLTVMKLQTFVNRCLRQILHIYWPNCVSNAELLIRANCRSIELEIRKRKWVWIGHILRRPLTEIARQALEWNPQGHRRQGRPRNTWIRCLSRECEDMGRSWNQIKYIARDRVQWKEFIVALCS